MTEYAFTLFGRFTARYDENQSNELERGKGHALLCYLLLNRRQAHSREDLASLFWADFTTAQSRKYLRQTLWQVQKALDSVCPDGPKLLSIQTDWVRISDAAPLWLDVHAFESGFALLKGLSGGLQTGGEAGQVQAAAELYTGPLLSGAYYDWCIFERERLESMYLLMLDRLMDYCLTRGEYDTGVAYGMSALRYDRARESTHRRLIRLFYLAGDRTAALHQYSRCVKSLEKELSVLPSIRTQELYEDIRADRWDTVLRAG